MERRIKKVSLADSVSMKTYCFVHSLDQFLFKFGFGFVQRNVKAVKTGVCFRQRVRIGLNQYETERTHRI